MCVRCPHSPSGAHQQPWHFVVIENQSLKDTIREVVEAEEQLNYDRRMRKSWVSDVQGLVSALHHDGTVLKPYLSEAPYLVLVMKETSHVDEEGVRKEIYYPEHGVRCLMPPPSRSQLLLVLLCFGETLAGWNCCWHVSFGAAACGPLHPH